MKRSDNVFKNNPVKYTRLQHNFTCIHIGLNFEITKKKENKNTVYTSVYGTYNCLMYLLSFVY